MNVMQGFINHNELINSKFLAGRGWRAKVEPANDIIDNFEFKFLVIASGKNVPLEGFDRRSLDAKMAIAVTANFVIDHTAEEAEVSQISGIAKQFYQVRAHFN